MYHPERGLRGRITSIPKLTPLDVLRRGVTIQIGGGSLLGSARGVPREPATGETDWSKEVKKHLFQKQPGWEKARPVPLYERDGRIRWEAEVIEDYDGKGDLGVILQFAGIELTEEPFLRGILNYGPDSAAFHAPIIYGDKRAHLVLVTRGDVFESQIVPARINVSPFFQNELYLPQLATYDPTSMAVSQNNRLVIVGYNPILS